MPRLVACRSSVSSSDGDDWILRFWNETGAKFWIYDYSIVHSSKGTIAVKERQQLNDN